MFNKDQQVRCVDPGITDLKLDGLYEVFEYRTRVAGVEVPVVQVKAIPGNWYSASRFVEHIPQFLQPTSEVEKAKIFSDLKKASEKSNGNKYMRPKRGSFPNGGWEECSKDDDGSVLMNVSVNIEDTVMCYWAGEYHEAVVNFFQGNKIQARRKDQNPWDGIDLIFLGFTHGGGWMTLEEYADFRKRQEFPTKEVYNTDPDKKVPITELDHEVSEPVPFAFAPQDREPITHRLKACPATMRLLRQGEISSNVRKHDRDYRKGDKIIFNEYIASPTCIENKGRWTSATFMAEITHVADCSVEGIIVGYCVLSLSFKLGECLGHDFELGGKYDPR